MIRFWIYFSDCFHNHETLSLLSNSIYLLCFYFLSLLFSFPCNFFHFLCFRLFLQSQNFVFCKFIFCILLSVAQKSCFSIAQRVDNFIVQIERSVKAPLDRFATARHGCPLDRSPSGDSRTVDHISIRRTISCCSKSTAGSSVGSQLAPISAAQPPTAFSVNKPPQVVSQPQISGSGQIPCHSRLARAATGPCHSATFALPQAAMVLRLLFPVTVF
jgi:hypothetical protein